MKTEQWFDVLVNGSPERTLTAQSEEAAVIAALVGGLVAGPDDSVCAAARIQEDWQ